MRLKIVKLILKIRNLTIPYVSNYDFTNFNNRDN